jgi:hypothetical protein
MVVKIRFGRGPVVTSRKGKNSRAANLAGSCLTLVSLGCASLGLWRLGTDLDWAGNFFISTGLLSHWQVWIGIAVATQYMSWRLVRYAGSAFPIEADEDLAMPEPRPERVAANI